MSCEIRNRTVLVSLPVSFVEALLDMRTALDDDLASALEKAVGGSPASSASQPCETNPKTITPGRGNYTAEFLGVAFSANTLPEVFERVIDMTADVAPEALDSLAKRRSPTGARRYVAREPGMVHLNSPRLPVARTTSGWWISKNISRENLIGALRALCEVSELSFGKDLKFPL